MRRLSASRLNVARDVGDSGPGLGTVFSMSLDTLSRILDPSVEPVSLRDALRGRLARGCDEGVG